jgi:hypothetical protein
VATIILRAFMDQVLMDMRGGSVASQNIINFMIAWGHLEGGGQTNNAHFNPLNTMQQEKGSVNFSTGNPGSGVQSYPDDKTGIKATEDALNNGHYGALVHALTTNDEINLGFTRRGSPSFANMMARNIATELSTWSGHGGLLDLAAQQYILNLMHSAGIPNASIEGGNASGSNSATPQATIDSWGNVSLGQDTTGITVGGTISNLTGTGSALSLWTSNDVIKVALGVLMLLIGAVLFIKAEMPTSGIAKAATKVIPFL